MAAANEQIINFPAVAGLDAYTDPNNLKPPALLQADNLTVVNLGELRTRRGFELVEGAAGEPATAFDGDAVPNVSVEAVGEYAGTDGERTVLAAGSKLYEFVGSDALHGWRTVNRLPEFVGTLHSVSPSGASVIEVESIVVAGGTLRVTAWVTGTRTGQELTSDLVYQSQTTGDGNSVYFSVQREGGGAFVKPPTRVAGVLTAYVRSATNLRMAVLEDAGSDYVLVAWRASGGGVEYVVIDPDAGSVTPTQAPLLTTGQVCHRSFDCVALRGSGTATAVFGLCKSDSGGSVSPAVLEARAGTINVVTGAWTLVSTVADIIDHTPPGAGAWFNPWANRGIVLEQEPAYVGGTWTVSFGARVVSRYYSAPATATVQLDGQLVLGRMTFNGTTLTSQPAQAYVPFIGFQTEDAHTSVLGLPQGGVYQSAQATARTGIFTQWATTTPYPLPTGLNSSIILTGRLADGTVQPYVTTFSNNYTGNGVTNTALFIMMPGEAYDGRDRSRIAASGLYPRPFHIYDRNAPQAMTCTGTDLRQTNQLFIPAYVAGVENFGFTANAIIPGVQFQNAGVTICTATIATDVNGSIVEVAIESGMPGNYPAAAPGNVPITGVVGAGAGTLNTATAWNFILTPLGSNNLVNARDIPEVANLTTNPLYRSPRGLEHCVHRWSVLAQDANIVLAVATVATNSITTPNSDAPYGAASPHTQNNAFELYSWNAAGAGGPLRNITAGGGGTSNLITALGGPWRLVAGLQAIGTNDFICAVCPAGDEFQQSTFLVRSTAPFSSVTITDPGTGKSMNQSSSQFVTYEGSIGLFVESCNAMRTTAVPYNVPRLTLSNAYYSCGLLRNGSSKGSQEVMVATYERAPRDWRRLVKFSDYTFINGGVVSAFDGATACEAVPLLWPQKDFTSINWTDIDPELYVVSQLNAGSPVLRDRASSFFNMYGFNGSTSIGSYHLINITRPWFKYEAGLYGKNGDDLAVKGIAWGSMFTYWGGNPALNYENVYVDQRIQQLSTSPVSGYTGGLSQAGGLSQHYYGRYQANPALYDNASPPKPLAVGPNNSLALWQWAPRSAAGWATEEASLYNPADAGGDFLMRWTYEYADGTGRMVRSAPSSPTVYTVCAQILGAWARQNDVPSYYGGEVSEFRWGFFAPRLELTNRLQTAGSDPRRVVLQPYTTAEPYSTVLYRVPFSSFDNPVSDFVVGRNQTRGIVPYANVPVSSPNPLGFVINNFRLFDGPTGDYNGIMSEPFLYTTGGVLDNVAPPSCKAMCVHQNRLVIGGADDPTVVWFTKELTATDAPGFNDALTFTLEEGGAVTGLASLESALVIFKPQDIFVISGTMPDATGYGPSLATPIKLPHGVGCRDHRSVIETPIGIFFQSDRTIELLTPALELKPVGLQFNGLDGLDTMTITSTSHNAERQEVYFTYYFTTDAQRRSQVAVFNYGINGWLRWTLNPLGTGSQLMATIGGQNQLVCSGSNIAGAPQALFYRESSIYADKVKNNSYAFITTTLLTATFAMHEVQGYERAKRASVLLNPATGSYPTIQIQVRGPAQSPPQLATWTPTEVGSLMTSTNWSGQLEVHVSEQKNRAVLLGIVTSGTGAANNIPLRIAGFAFRIGLKTGFNKRTTETARH